MLGDSNRGGDRGEVSEFVNGVDTALQDIVETMQQAYGPNFDDDDMNELWDYHGEAVDALDAAYDADPSGSDRELVEALDDVVDAITIFLSSVETLEKAEANSEEAFSIIELGGDFDQAAEINDEADSLIDPGRAGLYAAKYELEKHEDLVRSELDRFDPDAAHGMFDGVQQWAQFIDWGVTGDQLLVEGLIQLDKGEDAALVEDIDRARRFIQEGSDLITAAVGTYEHITRMDIAAESKQAAREQLEMLRDIDGDSELMEDAVRAADNGNMEKAEELFAKALQEM